MTPVLVCGFNRADTLTKVLDAVSAYKPTKLYLALDFPRDGRLDDIAGWELCKGVCQNINWQCDVKRNYAERNMGCKVRITSAVSWVLEENDRVIVLEDDCVPHPSWFRFCDELLERYKDDSRVGMISAEKEFFDRREIDLHGDSYYFDRMAFIGAGWATWRRVWRLHDTKLGFFPKMVAVGVMENIFQRKRYVRRWQNVGQRLFDGRQKTWAGGWAMTLYKENMLTIHPSVDASINLGFCRSSRNNAERDEFITPLSTVKTAQEIIFPLQHPVSMVPNLKAEYYACEDSLYRSAFRKILIEPLVALRRMARMVLSKK